MLMAIFSLPSVTMLDLFRDLTSETGLVTLTSGTLSGTLLYPLRADFFGTITVISLL